MSKILVVDDEPRTLLLLRSFLASQKYEVETAASGPEALDILTQKPIDIMITDLRMAPMDGLSLYKEASKIHPTMPIILLTAYASVETAIEAMKIGVFDYLTKPFKIDEIMDVVQRALERTQPPTTPTDTPTPTQPHSAAPRPAVDTFYAFDGIIANSAIMKRVCDMVQKVAPTTATVLINGESGSGKEVFAKALHQASPRKDAPWIAINCAALPEPLLESEMFGHVKGAFTGAQSDKVGLFEAANGGTFFLDEINSLPLVLQGKLLRVLQEHEVRRVGSIVSTPVDVRVIAASNTNLEQQMVDGTFRADLYYRLAVVELDIPSLAKRKEDIIHSSTTLSKLKQPTHQPSAASSNNTSSPTPGPATFVSSKTPSSTPSPSTPATNHPSPQISYHPKSSNASTHSKPKSNKKPPPSVATSVPPTTHPSKASSNKKRSTTSDTSSTKMVAIKKPQPKSSTSPSPPFTANSENKHQPPADTARPFS